MIWPEEFANNQTDFSTTDMTTVLAMQLVAWGNFYAGSLPPVNFFEIMDAASKVTGAFTPEQCYSLSNIILGQRKNKDDCNDD